VSTRFGRKSKTPREGNDVDSYRYKIEAWLKRRVVWDNTSKSTRAEFGDVKPPERVNPIHHYLCEELLKQGVTLTANMVNYHTHLVRTPPRKHATQYSE
jgi:hypothetical protein